MGKLHCTGTVRDCSVLECISLNISKPNSIMIRHVNVKNVKNKRPSLLYYKTKGKTLKEIIDE